MSEDPEIAEAYIALLGVLRLSRALTSGNAILVTSAEPSEGKTTVASCLARTAALAGQTVLLIDGDLRRQSLASAIDIADSVGLTEILFDQADAAETIHPLVQSSESTAAGSISVMGGGRQAPVVLPGADWTNARMAFRSIAERFGIVFLDSPPISAANDALLLANLVDAIVLVVGAGSTNLDELRKAKEQLDSIGAPIVGTVLNRFEPRIHGRLKQRYRSYNGRAK